MIFFIKFLAYLKIFQLSYCLRFGSSTDSKSPTSVFDRRCRIYPFHMSLFGLKAHLLMPMSQKKVN